MSSGSGDRRRYVPPQDPTPRVVLVRGDAEVACWPLPPGPHADIWVVDQIARLQLAARRLGYSIRLRDAPGELLELINLAGLSEIVTDAAGPGY
jgi:hypothetical protein